MASSNISLTQVKEYFDVKGNLSSLVNAYMPSSYDKSKQVFGSQKDAFSNKRAKYNISHKVLELTSHVFSVRVGHKTRCQMMSPLGVCDQTTRPNKFAVFVCECVCGRRWDLAYCGVTMEARLMCFALRAIQVTCCCFPLHSSQFQAWLRCGAFREGFPQLFSTNTGEMKKS